MSQTVSERSSSLTALNEKLEQKTARVMVVGLGYVGLPMAVELGKAGFTVLGVDVRRGVELADVLPQALGNRDQQPVSDVVAEAVVDDLKAIDVQQQHGEVVVVKSLASGHGLGEPIDQLGPARQIGQGVVLGRMFELLLGAVTRADVGKRGNHAVAVLDNGELVPHFIVVALAGFLIAEGRGGVDHRDGGVEQALLLELWHVLEQGLPERAELHALRADRRLEYPMTTPPDRT